MFLKDPLPYLGQVAVSTGADLVLQHECPDNLFNSGFWWARPSAEVRQLLEQLAKALDSPEIACDQHLLNSLLKKIAGVRTAALDAELFAAGNQFLTGQVAAKGGVLIDRRYEPFPFAAAYLLHFNYLVGKGPKAAKMVRMGVAFHGSVRRLGWQYRLGEPLGWLRSWRRWVRS